MERIFVPLDYLCPDCESRATTLKDRTVHVQPANSKYKLLDISDIRLGWTLFCHNCKALFIKGSSLDKEMLSQLNSSKIEIFYGAHAQVRILKKGAMLKVKDPGPIFDEKGKRVALIPETVTI